MPVPGTTCYVSNEETREGCVPKGRERKGGKKASENSRKVN